MKQFIDFVVITLFVLFMIFLVRGFILQSSKKRRDLHNRDKKD